MKVVELYSSDLNIFLKYPSLNDTDIRLNFELKVFPQNILFSKNYSNCDRKKITLDDSPNE